MEIKEPNINGESLSVLLNRYFVNLDKSPVDFIGSLLMELQSGKIDDGAFCYYFLKKMGDVKLHVVHYPADFYAEIKVIWRNELLLADAINDKLKDWHYGMEGKDVIGIFRELLSDNNFMSKLKPCE